MLVSSSEALANGLGDVVSSAVGSVFGAFSSAAAPPANALAPLAATLGESVTAEPGRSAGWLFPCGAVAGVDGSDFAGAGGFGLALKLDRHCTKSRPKDGGEYYQQKKLAQTAAGRLVFQQIFNVAVIVRLRI